MAVRMAIETRMTAMRGVNKSRGEKPPSEKSRTKCPSAPKKKNDEPALDDVSVLSASAGKKRASETTNPFDSAASDVTRASQFIHPVSNPTKSPNAVLA